MRTATYPSTIRLRRMVPLPQRAGGGTFDQVDQARQESRQGLARAGRRDQQHAPPGESGLDHLELVTPRRPSARGEPVGDHGWQRVAALPAFS